MKTGSLPAITFLVSLFLGHFSYAQKSLQSEDGSIYNSPKSIVDIYDAYVPNGYDINSNVEVAINVFQPDDCHPWSGVLLTQNSPYIHEIRALLKVVPGLCFSKVTPLTKMLSLGRLVAGMHEVRFFKQDGTYIQKELYIAE
jgi:hypothetical protein